MAKSKAAKGTLGGQDKALVIAALDRATSVLESKDNGGKAEALASGAYPVDLSVRITGDINVGASSAIEEYEVVADQRHFGPGLVLAAIWIELGKQGLDPEGTVNAALKIIASARKKGEGSREAVALLNAGNDAEAFQIERGKKLGLIETTKRTVPASTRAGARTGKPDVAINAEVFGAKRGVTFTVGGGGAKAA